MLRQRRTNSVFRLSHCTRRERQVQSQKRIPRSNERFCDSYKLLLTAVHTPDGWDWSWQEWGLMFKSQEGVFMVENTSDHILIDPDVMWACSSKWMLRVTKSRSGEDLLWDTIKLCTDCSIPVWFAMYKWHAVSHGSPLRWYIRGWESTWCDSLVWLNEIMLKILEPVLCSR